MYGLGFSKKSIDCENSWFTKTEILKFLLPFLCLLQMNLFYQKFFFVAWWLLLILMAMSIYGLLFCLVQFFSVSFAQYWLSKNLPISIENILKSFFASDCFVLILLFENLNPVLFHELLKLLSKKKEQKMKR